MRVPIKQKVFILISVAILIYLTVFVCSVAFFSRGFFISVYEKEVEDAYFRIVSDIERSSNYKENLKKVEVKAPLFVIVLNTDFSLYSTNLHEAREKGVNPQYLERLRMIKKIK